MTELFGYMLEPLREDTDFTLYRGRQHGNPSQVLVVALTTQPSAQALRRLEHEHSLAAELDSTWAAKPLSLTRHEGHSILMLTDPGGEPLDRVLERNLEEDHDQPLYLTLVLHRAIGLAKALGQVHRRGLIHKDIKPANVLVDDAGNAWLTGFGIASQLPHERQSPVPIEIIAGTLAYMAPEQTGRMNRSTDSRSDLYSVGVTLYQMLTGALPFAAADALGWVHCHIARMPVPPSDRAAVPEPLSAIVMKLLAKNAEERYQTASGLEADLRRCLTEWRTHGRVDPFSLGAHDSSDRLLIPEKLYGREREIDVLLAAFDRVVAQGMPELVLVSGYSGVGKSSVVNELHKVLVRQRGLFASGKFDQYQRDIPYTTLAQAFQTLIRQLLAKSAAEVSDWRHALQGALGTHGQLIVNLIPDLEFLIGKQPPVPDLPPQDARNRFQLVFRRFLSAFATPEHPLALFLDDLQWLDPATLDLLEHLITDQDVRYLMVVGAYRDNEVSSSHPLTRTLASIRKAGARMQEIVLSPLGLDDVGRLVSDALHCELDSGQPLAELVHEKTGGNPFFAIQFLSALAEEGLLRLDPDAAAWIWDLARIRAKGYTDNAVDLMVGKLKRLSSETQSALQQLACLGNVVDFGTLTLVFGKSEEEIHTALWEATRMRLILRLDGSYAFLHDRIQESAYALIPEGERARAHLRIGQALLSSMTADQLTEHLFDIANQLNRGAPLLIDRDERVHAATINLRTGRKAKAAAAYASAGTHFSAGMALLDETDWDSQYQLTFSLWLELAECEFLSSNIEKAEQLVRDLLQRRISRIEKVAVYRLRILIHIVRAENAQAVASALECLSLFDIDLPAHPTSEQVQTEYEIVWKSLDGRPIESLIDLQLMSDPELQAAMQVLSALTPAAYDSNIRLFCMVVCRMVNVSVQHGMSDASVHGFAHLGSILGPVFHRYSEASRFAKLACDLVQKHGFIAYEAKAYNSMALAAQWTQPITTAVDFLRAMFRAATETGDLTYACYAMYLSVTEFVVRNDPLDVVWVESEMALDFVRQAGFRDVADIIRSQQRFITTMQGRTATFSTFSDASFDEATFEAQLTADRLAQLVCYYWIVKLKTRFLSGNHAEALEAVNKAKPLLGAAAAQIQLLDYFYYTALTVSALYENASAEEQTRWRELLTAHREQLREWTESYPPTFADKHALVSAEIARVEGRSFDAMRLYEEAIQSAREHSFVQNEALAYEVAARFYLAHGFETIAHTYLRNARSCYDRWGASGKVRQLDERYPRLHQERLPASATTTIGTRAGQLDVESVVKASQVLSGEIVLNKLIEKLMQIAVEHAGAERGLLVLLRGDEPRIEAEATTGRGSVDVAVRQTAVTPSDLPQSALHYVIRTRERVVLDDAPVGTSYSEDEYVRRKRPRSVLCLPVVKQTKLVGALYLENSLTPCAFTTDRVAVLELLASQAAISLENASLYSELQRSESFLRRSEESLLEAQRLSHAGSWRRDVASGVVTLSPEIYRIFEISPDESTSDAEFWSRQIHPEDRERVLRAVQKSAINKTDYESDYRIVLSDGRIKYLHAVGHPIVNESGNIVEFVGTSMDVTGAKQAEDRIRQSESEFRQILEFAPQHVSVLGPDPNRTRLFVNQAALDYFGLTFEEWRDGDRSRLYHPDDWVRMLSETKNKFSRGLSHETEVRLLRKDGEYRWFLFRWSPLRDEQGQLRRWYVAGTDIEDRKHAEQRLQNENVALREEIDKASMFEEIVGTSPPLQAVLSRISKVAPTDSSVLITGETGTGKELVARAIHRRSRRSSRAFVSVNCAAIPHDLIASELFGHEKGAFTGATQRRLGRFELAEGGTIFLDELGELPAETQIALLRVLQEHEFERVGGTGSIPNDVRVIAATNRDLKAGIAAGIFRSDLFYRLNVFPIEMPALRERREDIPLLVGYFIERYARREGKSFRAVDKRSLDLLQSYPWPGNIRELQNVIERSSIVSSGDIFSVDESWLSKESSQPPSQVTVSPSMRGESRGEREIIEAALAESRGRVSGPSGAAAKLRIPPSTLESRIKVLKIGKSRFKFGGESRKTRPQGPKSGESADQNP